MRIFSRLFQVMSLIRIALFVTVLVLLWPFISRLINEPLTVENVFSVVKDFGGWAAAKVREFT